MVPKSRETANQGAVKATKRDSQGNQKAGKPAAYIRDILDIQRRNSLASSGKSHMILAPRIDLE